MDYQQLTDITAVLNKIAKELRLLRIGESEDNDFGALAGIQVELKETNLKLEFIGEAICSVKDQLIAHK